MKTLYRILFILHTFVGVGALVGGIAAILNPHQPLGMPVEALKNSPFNNFLIPGIILFAVIGLGNIIAAFLVLKKSKMMGFISSIFSCGLVIFIVVQCIMLNTVHFLHVIYFSIGLVEFVLSAIIMFKQRLYPVNFFRND